MIWVILITVSAFKLLFFYSYRSTDFEVHRNWLAVTYSTPVASWYNESTSEWTLDYPPFFAWFEFTLSHVAKFVDPEMLRVTNLNYDSFETVAFQKLSVILADLILFYGTLKCAQCVTIFKGGKGYKKDGFKTEWWKTPYYVLLVLVMANAGLLLVDHIHFQYNGFLFGILLISVALIINGENLQGAFWFAVLLNFKHIFMYMAPAYFVYLLRSYCMFPHLAFIRTAKLGLLVILVFSLSFGPFVYYKQLPQVLSRLFPFKRGLCHAYWAPNFWSLYNVLDKVLLVLGRRLGYNVTESGAGVMTGGLVQEFKHSVLFEITPLVTFVITFISILPALRKLWRSPFDPFLFLHTAILCSFSAFMFGWHVHEKAIFMITIPLTVLAVRSPVEAELYKFLSVIAHYSLFPLLFTQFETPVKVLIFASYTVFTCYSLSYLFGHSQGTYFSNFKWIHKLYLLGFILLFLFENCVHPFTSLRTTLPFLPLMLTSVYCAVGITYSWLYYYTYVLYHYKSQLKTA